MVSNGNVTGLVDRLEQQRQVVRVPHRTDRRASRVRLTEGGRRVLLVMAAVHQDWIKEAFARLAPEDGPALVEPLACVEIAVLAVLPAMGGVCRMRRGS